MNQVKNPFWHDVLKHYKRLHVKCQLKVKNVSDFNAECIFLNDKIIVDHHTVYFRDWLQLGVYQIHHILNERGTYLSFDEFKEKYPTLTTNFLIYRGLVESIKKYQNNIQVIQDTSNDSLDQKTWQIIFEGNKSVQSSLIAANSSPAGVAKWNSMFADLNWKTIFYKCHRTTVDCQLKWFQLRLLYRALPTNRYLFLRKIVDSAKCSICDQEEETINHLMWNCPYVHIFWQELKTSLLQHCTHIQNFNFSEQLILFGVKENMHTDKGFDFILLLAKFYIYKCKWTSSKPLAQVFLKLLKSRYRMEKYFCMMPQNPVSFELIWQPYLNLIN
jgi:hypothetical protein